MEDRVLLKVKGKKISLIMGKCNTFEARFYGPFEVLNRVGTIAYDMDLPPTIKVYNFFHIPLLKKYLNDPNYILDCSLIHEEPEGGI